MSLKLAENSSDDIHLKKAVEISNNFMMGSLFNTTIETELNVAIVDEIISKTKNVKIEFKKQKKSKRQKKVVCLGWTYRSKELDKIYINKIFSQRLNSLSDSSAGRKETIIITVFISIIILHELAHLLLRWKGQKHSPPRLKEAGIHLEENLFFGTVRLIIISNKNLKDLFQCVGIGIEDKDGVVKFLGYRDYVQKIYNGNMPSDLIFNLKLIKRKMKSTETAMKRSKNTSLEPTNEMIIESLGYKKCNEQE